MTLWFYVLSCVVCVFLGFFVQALMFSSSLDDVHRSIEQQASNYYEKYYKKEYEERLRSLSELTEDEGVTGHTGIIYDLFIIPF